MVKEIGLEERERKNWKLFFFLQSCIIKPFLVCISCGGVCIQQQKNATHSIVIRGEEKRRECWSFSDIKKKKSIFKKDKKKYLA